MRTSLPDCVINPQMSSFVPAQSNQFQCAIIILIDFFKKYFSIHILTMKTLISLGELLTYSGLKD